MPFEQKFDDVYRLVIQAAAEELGVIAQRVDEQVFHKESILERIYNQIEVAGFIIAEVTGKSPNYFCEFDKLTLRKIMYIDCRKV